MRTARNKLIRYYEVNESEMFDLERDPEELKSVYADASYSSVRKELETKLESLRARYAVPQVHPAPYSLWELPPEHTRPGILGSKRNGEIGTSSMTSHNH